MFPTKWTKEKIQEGFDKFFTENGRYPTALEIDAYGFLPSSRQIQRAFGGLVKLRQDLGLEITNFGIGNERSKIATIVNHRGRNLEKKVEQVLIEHFGEHFVHIEKPLNKYYIGGANSDQNNKFRADFFVYAKNYQFCIDVFYASNWYNFVNIMNIKKPNYTGLKIDVYLVNMNDGLQLTGERIATYKKKRLTQLEPNIRIMNQDIFINFIKTLKPLEIKGYNI